MGRTSSTIRALSTTCAGVVVIPFSSGQVFGLEGFRGWEFAGGEVVIPFSSGQVFGLKSIFDWSSDSSLSRNPLFIGSSLRTGPPCVLQLVCHAVRRNPLFIGSSLRTEVYYFAGRGPARQRGRNPLFIGSSLRTRRACMPFSRRSTGRNPLFIGSSLRTMKVHISYFKGAGS